MRYLILITILFNSVLSFAAVLPPKWRFEYNYGRVTSHYLEEQPSILFTKANIKQVSDSHQFIYQYYLLPPWLDLSMGANIAGLSVEEPVEKEEQFTYITAFLNMGVVLPLSDYWHIKLVLERFYTTMIVEDDAFGFRNLQGNQIYPEVEWLPFGSKTFIQVSPYFKVPLISDVGNRKETTIGLKVVMPLSGSGAQKFPSFAYQKSLIFRIFYTNMELEFRRSDFIPSDIGVRQIGASLGFNF